MTEMFYVIYSANADQYVNTDDGLDNFAKATRFASSKEAKAELAGDYADDYRVVGPCNEGDYK